MDSLLSDALYEEPLHERVTILDDFDLFKIIDSGQNFRATIDSKGTAQFLTGNHLLLIRHIKDQQYAISVDKETWEKVWVPYFDLSRDYRLVRRRAMAQGGYLRQAAIFGRGIRILRQQPWEMLITFILSQRKSVPAIRSAIRVLTQQFGEPYPFSGMTQKLLPSFSAFGVQRDEEDVRQDKKLDRLLFPTPKRLLPITENEFRSLGFGYRAPYLVSAVEEVTSGRLDLHSLIGASEEEMLEALQSVKGVGIKVARCVMLYGYGCMHSAPVDVWIQRAIDQYFGGVNIFDIAGEDAGIWQQYVFYAMRKRMAW